jgi:hypothetical protein
LIAIKIDRHNRYRLDDATIDHSKNSSAVLWNAA